VPCVFPQKTLLNIVTSEFTAWMPIEVLTIVRLEMETFVNPLAVITAVEDPGFWRIALAVSTPAIGRLFINVMDSVYVPGSMIILSFVVLFAAALIAAVTVVKQVVEDGVLHTLLTVNVMARAMPGIQKHSSVKVANESSMIIYLRIFPSGKKFFQPYHKEYAKVNQRTGHQSAWSECTKKAFNPDTTNNIGINFSLLFYMQIVL
jgi:hypothetical protein